MVTLKELLQQARTRIKLHGEPDNKAENISNQLQQIQSQVNQLETTAADTYKAKKAWAKIITSANPSEAEQTALESKADGIFTQYETLKKSKAEVDSKITAVTAIDLTANKPLSETRQKILAKQKTINDFMVKFEKEMTMAKANVDAIRKKLAEERKGAERKGNSPVKDDAKSHEVKSPSSTATTLASMAIPKSPAQGGHNPSIVATASTSTASATLNTQSPERKGLSPKTNPLASSKSAFSNPHVLMPTPSAPSPTPPPPNREMTPSPPPPPPPAQIAAPF